VKTNPRGLHQSQSESAGLSHTDPLFMDPPQRQRCVALVCDSLLVGARSLLPQGELDASPSARG
jgi:hypothetical protein